MDADRVKAIFDEIAKYDIELDPDPSARGPQYLQEAISKCRGYINAVSKILRDLILEKRSINQELVRQQAVYEVESSELLATNESIRRQPNIKDRQAMIDVLLRERVGKINDLKMQLTDLDFVEKAVKHQHKELKDTMAEIRLQRSLIRDEIDTGSMYGDESNTSRGRAIPQDDVDDESLASIFASSGMGNEGAGTESGATNSSSDEASPSGVRGLQEDISDEEAIQNFLDGPTAAVGDHEFSDLLEDF